MPFTHERCFPSGARIGRSILTESKAAGLMALKGHRIAGGMRAVSTMQCRWKVLKILVSFMDDFAKKRA